MSDNLCINGRKLHLFHMEVNVTCIWWISNQELWSLTDFFTPHLFIILSEVSDNGALSFLQSECFCFATHLPLTYPKADAEWGNTYLMCSFICKCWFVFYCFIHLFVLHRNRVRGNLSSQNCKAFRTYLLHELWSQMSVRRWLVILLCVYLEINSIWVLKKIYKYCFLRKIIVNILTVMIFTE